VADSDTLRFYPKVDYEILLYRMLPAYSLISGYMFEDHSVNGLQDAGEPGMANSDNTAKRHE